METNNIQEAANKWISQMSADEYDFFAKKYGKNSTTHEAWIKEVVMPFFTNYKGDVLQLTQKYYPCWLSQPDESMCCHIYLEEHKEKEEYWLWYWGKDQSDITVHSEPIQFDDFDEMKVYSANHSAENKHRHPGYWSTYDKIVPSKEEKVLPKTVEEPLDILANVLKASGVRQYLNINNFGYSQVERNIVDELTKWQKEQDRQELELEKAKNNKLSEALQKIVLEVDKTEVKLIDTASPLQMALYTIYHTAKEALKEQ